MKTIGHTPILTLLVVLMISMGCHEQSRYRTIQGRLDRALYFYETDRYNEAHDISREVDDPNHREPSRVPAPALVDIDSQIHVRVNTESLTSESDANLPGETSAALLKRKETIRKALGALAVMVERRAEAIRLFKQDDPEIAGRVITLFGNAEAELIDTLETLWDDPSPEYDIMIEAYENITSDPKLTPIYVLLKSELDAIETADRSLVDHLRDRKVSLRLEAQVMGDGEVPRFIHMEGYDTMEQGRLLARDRGGLNLSPEERNNLEKQVKATQEVAKAAERLRRKEITFQEALASAGPFISEELTTSIQEIQKLVDKYDADGTRKKLDEIADLYVKLVPKIEESASDLSEQLRAELRATPEDFNHWIEANHFESLPKLYAGIASVEDLRRRWRNPTYADQTGLVLDSARVFREFRTLLDDKQFQVEIAEAINQYIQSRSPTFQKVVLKALEDIQGSEEYEALEQTLDEIQEDFMHLMKLAETIATKLAYFGGARDAEEVPSPHAIDVPIEDIRDTHMDLRRVQLNPGDEIMLRGILKKDDKEVDSTTSSFKVTRFKWYAELSPSVVLVRPDTIEGGENDFQFAPALSWLHHYVPRPHEDDWIADMLRTFDPAIGPHSIFLSFDTPQDDDAIQIGLGTTLSIWDKRLQFGAGYNLMADDDDDGEIYYFVGTDLIGLLQQITGNPMR